MKKFLLKALGVFFLILGIAGLVLPVIQGWLCIFIGLSLLSPRIAARVRSALFLRFCKSASFGLDEWDRLGVRAGFSTRLFHFHLKSTDDLDAEEARNAVRGLWPHGGGKPRPNRFVYLKQVHGNRVVAAGPDDFGAGDFLRVPDADALVTQERKTALLVLSADCLPIFFVAQREDKPVAVAAAHAGWRGTRQKIAVETLARLKQMSGASFEDIYAAFGPSIGVEHYEVGGEFRAHFPAESLREKNGKLYFDLRKENERQLIAAGLKRSQIIDTHLTTVTDNRLFYSFRLEKDASGRTISYIFIP